MLVSNTHSRLLDEMHTSVIPTSHRKGPSVVRHRKACAHADAHVGYTHQPPKGSIGCPPPKGMVNPMLTKSVADIWKCSPHRISHERIRQPSSQHRDTRVAREASWNRSFVREQSAGRRSPNNRGKPCKSGTLSRCAHVVVVSRRRARRACSLITERTKTATYLHDDSPN